MMPILLFVSFLGTLTLAARPHYVDDGMCTGSMLNLQTPLCKIIAHFAALGLGRLATIDQSTITTHNADCR
jgi:hypothetical protein